MSKRWLSGDEIMERLGIKRGIAYKWVNLSIAFGNIGNMPAEAKFVQLIENFLIFG